MGRHVDEIFICPQKYLRDDWPWLGELFEAYRMLQKGMAPYDGGYLNQTALYTEGIKQVQLGITMTENT